MKGRMSSLKLSYSPPGRNPLGAPALRLLPAIVHGLQAAGQVGVLRDALAADLVIRCYPPRHHRHH